MAFIKTSILLCLLLGHTQAGRTQGMRKTMLAQLTALRAYIITAEKGYRIAEEGLHFVRDIKSGEYFLHETFFASLKTVDEGVLQNPELRRSYKVMTSIEQTFGEAKSAYYGSEWLRTDELQYMHGLQQRIAEEDGNAHKELQALTTDRALSMTDGERIRRIQDIAKSLQIRFSQVKNLLAEVAFLTRQRQKEQAHTSTLKKWYGIQ